MLTKVIKPYEVFAAIERKDIVYLMEIRDRAFHVSLFIICQNYINLYFLATCEKVWGCDAASSCNENREITSGSRHRSLRSVLSICQPATG